jgi:hypothetical protein
VLELSVATLTSYLAAIVVLMVTPGPDTMFVLANATRYGAGRRGLRARSRGQGGVACGGGGDPVRTWGVTGDDVCSPCMLG